MRFLSSVLPFSNELVFLTVEINTRSIASCLASYVRLESFAKLVPSERGLLRRQSQKGAPPRKALQLLLN